ncbi:hypothetical protein [Gilliamella apicola]|uniref:hypothetical protein n=1 Tax=Gilliamella apicola TaxID=1196095 RepID=UPI002FEE2FC3
MKAHALKSTFYDANILPGGADGTINLGKSLDVIQFIKSHDLPVNGFIQSVQ